MEELLQAINIIVQTHYNKNSIFSSFTVSVHILFSYFSFLSIPFHSTSLFRSNMNFCFINSCQSLVLVVHAFCNHDNIPNHFLMRKNLSSVSVLYNLYRAYLKVWRTGYLSSGRFSIPNYAYSKSWASFQSRHQMTSMETIPFRAHNVENWHYPRQQ